MSETPDYTGDYSAAKEQERQFLAYYHSRGFKWVKAWLEVDNRLSNQRFWYLRSNIHFVTPKL